MVHGDGFMVIALKVEHHTLATCHLIAHVSREDRRQWWHGHITTQIEARIGMLIVTTSGAIATVVRILLQAVDAICCGDIGGIAYKACRAVGILLGQDNLLAPVTNDITHKGRTGTCGTMSSP